MKNTFGLKQYFPAFGMVLATILTAFVPLLDDSRVTSEELLSLGIVAVGAFTTYLVPRLEGATWLKPATSVAFAVLNGVQMYLTNGVSAQEWLLIAISALGAVGVIATNKNVPVTPNS